MTSLLSRTITLIILNSFAYLSHSIDLTIFHENINSTLTSIDFGHVPVGEHRDVTVNFYNGESIDVLDNCGTYPPWNAPFTITSQTCGNWLDDRVPDPYSIHLDTNRGSSCSVTLRYSPTEIIRNENRLNFYCNDSSYNGNSRPSFFVDLAGSGGSSNPSNLVFEYDDFDIWPNEDQQWTDGQLELGLVNPTDDQYLASAQLAVESRCQQYPERYITANIKIKSWDKSASGRCVRIVKGDGLLSDEGWLYLQRQSADFDFANNLSELTTIDQIQAYIQNEGINLSDEELSNIHFESSIKDTTRRTLRHSECGYALQEPCVTLSISKTSIALCELFHYKCNKPDIDIEVKCHDGTKHNEAMNICLNQLVELKWKDGKPIKNAKVYGVYDTFFGKTDHMGRLALEHKGAITKPLEVRLENDIFDIDEEYYNEQNTLHQNSPIIVEAVSNDGKHFYAESVYANNPYNNERKSFNLKPAQTIWQAINYAQEFFEETVGSEAVPLTAIKVISDKQIEVINTDGSISLKNKPGTFLYQPDLNEFHFRMNYSPSAGLSNTSIIHEYGHRVMAVLYSGSLSYEHDGTVKIKNAPSCATKHIPGNEIDARCAFIEGWAFFYALMTGGEDSKEKYCLPNLAKCYDAENYKSKQAWNNIAGHSRVEQHNDYPVLDEGSVAAFLYDLFDEKSDDEPLDDVSLSPDVFYNAMKKLGTKDSCKIIKDSYTLIATQDCMNIVDFVELIEASVSQSTQNKIKDLRDMHDIWVRE